MSGNYCVDCYLKNVLTEEQVEMYDNDELTLRLGTTDTCSCCGVSALLVLCHTRLFTDEETPMTPVCPDCFAEMFGFVGESGSVAFQYTDDRCHCPRCDAYTKLIVDIICD